MSVRSPCGSIWPRSCRPTRSRPIPASPPVSAANYGSAGILPITWAYIALMGPDGLTRATETAVLSANYLAGALAPYYPVLYTGDGNLVAHECILDLRALTKRPV